MLVVDCCMGSGGDTGQGTLCREEMDLGEMRRAGEASAPAPPQLPVSCPDAGPSAGQGGVVTWKGGVAPLSHRLPCSISCRLSASSG